MRYSSASPAPLCLCSPPHHPRLSCLALRPSPPCHPLAVTTPAYPLECYAVGICANTKWIEVMDARPRIGKMCDGKQEPAYSRIEIKVIKVRNPLFTERTDAGTTTHSTRAAARIPADHPLDSHDTTRKNGTLRLARILQ